MHSPNKLEKGQLEKPADRLIRQLVLIKLSIKESLFSFVCRETALANRPNESIHRLSLSL